MARARSAKFADEVEVHLGHKGVVAAIVPFDPEQTFGQKPVKLAGRRHGWLVEGSVNGVAFAGYVGERWGRFFVMLDDALCKRAKVTPGETAKLMLRPTTSQTVFAAALEQSKITTQPTKARADALSMKSSR